MRKISGTVQQQPAKWPPRFFKILLPTYLQELPIPRRFVREFGENFPNVAFLKGPGDRLWRVELKETDGIISFFEGWKEFVENYCLQIGYLLVFRYDGNSQFSVLIFDKSACEKEYSSSNDNDEESCSGIGSCAPEKESDASIEILRVSKIENSDLNMSKERRKHIPKMLRSSLRLQSNARKMNLETTSKCSKRKEIIGEVTPSECQQSKFRKSVGSERCEVELQYHPPSAPRYGDNELNQSNRMELVESIHKSVSQCSKEKSRCDMAPMGGVSQRIVSSMPLSGEKLPVKREIQLSEPDDIVPSPEDIKCSLEPKKRMLQVKGRILCSLDSKKADFKAMEKQQELAEAIQFKSKYPFFMVSMKASNVRYVPRLQIPSQFVRKHLQDVPQYVLLKDHSGGSWKIRCLGRDGKVFLYGGWPSFLTANNIELGDLCAFELLNGRKTAFLVTVYQADELLPLKQLRRKWARRKFKFE